MLHKIDKNSYLCIFLSFLFSDMLRDKHNDNVNNIYYRKPCCIYVMLQSFSGMLQTSPIQRL